MGQGNALKVGGAGSRDTRYGAWVARWKHWSLKIGGWRTVGSCDMANARSSIECTYQRTTAEYLDMVGSGEKKPSQLGDGGFRPTRLDRVYFLDEWNN